MNKHSGQFLIYSLLIISVSCTDNRPQIEIFLLDKQEQSSIHKIHIDNSPNDYDYSKIDIAKLKLERNPIVTSKDIRYFDSDKSVLILNRIVKLSTKPTVIGLHFVVVTNGQRCTIGDFRPINLSLYPAESTTMIFEDKIEKIWIPKAQKELYEDCSKKLN
jgi:hypothetical protein